MDTVFYYADYATYTLESYIKLKVKEIAENKFDSRWYDWVYWLCVIMSDLQTIPLCSCDDLGCSYPELLC
jgi:hypothetical protein